MLTFLYYYIYKITNPKGAIYIGQTKRHPYIRQKEYATKCCVAQSKIYHSIKKYGWESHKFEVIYKFKAIDNNIDEIEKQFIKFFNSYSFINSKYGMNLTVGGNAPMLKRTGKQAARYNSKLSKIAKEKLAEAARKRVGKDNHKSKTVYQYTLSGEFVQEWISPSEVRRILGISNTNIYSVCNGTDRQACGYFWSYSFLGIKIDPILPVKNALMRSINCYTVDGVFIKNYESITLASK